MYQSMKVRGINVRKAEQDELDSLIELNVIKRAGPSVNLVPMEDSLQFFQDHLDKQKKRKHPKPKKNSAKFITKSVGRKKRGLLADFRPKETLAYQRIVRRNGKYQCIYKSCSCRVSQKGNLIRHILSQHDGNEGIRESLLSEYSDVSDNSGNSDEESNGSHFETNGSRTAKKVIKNDDESVKDKDDVKVEKEKENTKSPYSPVGSASPMIGSPDRREEKEEDKEENKEKETEEETKKEKESDEDDRTKIDSKTAKKETSDQEEVRRGFYWHKSKDVDQSKEEDDEDDEEDRMLTKPPKKRLKKSHPTSTRILRSATTPSTSTSSTSSAPSADTSAGGFGSVADAPRSPLKSVSNQEDPDVPTVPDDPSFLNDFQEFLLPSSPSPSPSRSNSRSREGYRKRKRSSNQERRRPRRYSRISRDGEEEDEDEDGSDNDYENGSKSWFHKNRRHSSRIFDRKKKGKDKANVTKSYFSDQEFSEIDFKYASDYGANDFSSFVPHTKEPILTTTFNNLNSLPDGLSNGTVLISQEQMKELVLQVRQLKKDNKERQKQVLKMKLAMDKMSKLNKTILKEQHANNLLVSLIRKEVLEHERKNKKRTSAY
eukprot:TRINITY_DN1250_c2_g1_i2.p1 TRINITY_DN1250_c2_g1~~TRINITY_DN1250_c2_g1_i2.p1  ORF type:complete len:664 (+),score=188.75 TRINITY_DN1250_c2_g1_i2:190-1992(+)